MTETQFHVQISTNGRISIPASLRKALNVKDGDSLVMTLQKDNTLRIQQMSQAIAESQKLVRQYFGDANLMRDLRELRALDHAKETKGEK